MAQGAIVPATTDAVCKTASVFWDVEDFPLPADRDLCWFRENLKEHLRKQGILGDVSITAYGEEKPDEVVNRYKDAGITFVSKGNKYWRLVLMMADIGLWTLGHRDVYNYDKTVLMLIVKDDKDTEFIQYIQNLDWVMYLSVFYVLVEQEPGPVPMVQEAWFWEKLLEGEEPMPQEEFRKICSQVKRNVKSPSFFRRPTESSGYNFSSMKKTKKDD
ncbi:hypothetical protein ISN45_Aa03g020620 [Arabidopsis thaliana x Arabidopsis arenosa]|uniref:NYN domain-containing protein n=1 Tax=Arabidopsis thaliana x Arabidopsis arenosa TaxID=1240361 RepID=A0A8T2AYJ7_9BRAS|nr:hypothetical protein ISN45_Aa03g020620 [Arabidopsis thaliana x Arabidopsis arenosa]